MADSSVTNFRYLNADGLWPGFRLNGVERRHDGSLTLATLPRLSGGSSAIAQLTEPSAPAGVAVAPDGTVYFSDPQRHRVVLIDGCDGSLRALPCLGVERDPAAVPTVPRGLHICATRRALVVADSANHDLRLFSLDSLQLVDVFGGLGTAPGRFDSPTALAGDSKGNIYVVDAGNRRVQKLDLWGNAVSTFWDRIASRCAAFRPVDVAVSEDENGVRVFVVDADNERIRVFDGDGNPLPSVGIRGIERALGICVAADAIYLGDNQRRRLLRLSASGQRIGESVGYDGPVAAIATDRTGGLWVHPGDGVPPRLEQHGAHVESGVLWGGPFSVASAKVAWHRLSTLGNALPSGAHFRFFVHATDSDSAPPVPAVSTPAAFDASWKALAPDVDDVLLGMEARYLWIGAQLSGDGSASPLIEQLRVSFDQETYTQHLPAIYQNASLTPTRPADARSLERFLALFESFFADVEDEVVAVERLFDAEGAPPEWLDWLAGWLAVDLEEDWPEAKKRSVLAAAFASYGWRGTARGLRQAVRVYAGVDAHVEEPLLQTAWWSLPPAAGEMGLGPEESILGFTTRLVSAEPQGAVLDTSAVLDGSHLISHEQYGAPLFEEVAHQFSVEVYEVQVDAEVLDRVRRVVEHEKPAHTTYHLCVIRPRMRIGVQARLGVDSVVGKREATPSRLGEDGALVLGGRPPGRLGHAHLGTTANLAAGTVPANNDGHQA